MTARKAGEMTAEGVFGTLGKVRDRWVLLVFAASALFWARDVYEQFVDLPARVAELGRALDELRTGAARSATGQALADVDRSAALALLGERRAMDDGRPDDPVTVLLAPVERVRGECRNGEFAAFMIDADGRWYSVETDLARVPQIEGPPQVVEATQDCDAYRRVDSSPRLHLRILPR